MNNSYTYLVVNIKIYLLETRAVHIQVQFFIQLTVNYVLCVALFTVFVDFICTVHCVCGCVCLIEPYARVPVFAQVTRGTRNYLEKMIGDAIRVYIIFSCQKIYVYLMEKKNIEHQITVHARLLKILSMSCSKRCSSGDIFIFKIPNFFSENIPMKTDMFYIQYVLCNRQNMQNFFDSLTSY